MIDINQIIDKPIAGLPLTAPSKALDVTTTTAPSKFPDNDRENVLDNLYELVDQGKVALSDLMRLAASSNHPRTYEVLTGMLKALSEINKDIIEVAQPPAPNHQTTIQTQQNVIVGSTKEILEMLKKNG